MGRTDFTVIPVIQEISRMTLCGTSLPMSLQQDRTAELWKGFMSIKNNIAGIQGSELFSVQVYPKDYFREFSQEREFTKWATVRVDAPVIPENGLRTLIIPDGLYAIFHYRGLSSDPSIFQYIFSEWLPFSGYSLADRPHFEVLGKNYRNNDPGSEEDIYIPVDPIQ